MAKAGRGRGALPEGVGVGMRAGCVWELNRGQPHSSLPVGGKDLPPQLFLCRETQGWDQTALAGFQPKS